MARIDFDDCGQLDDVFLEDVKSLHIERMDRGHIWMGISLSNGREYMVNFATPRRGKLLWMMEQDLSQVQPSKLMFS